MYYIVITISATTVSVCDAQIPEAIRQEGALVVTRRQVSKKDNFTSLILAQIC